MPAPRQERASEMEALNAKSVTCMSVMERFGGCTCHRACRARVREMSVAISTKT